MSLVHRSPRVFGLEQSRWTLAGLRDMCVWLYPLTLAGVHSVLKRLGVVWKRARSCVLSPDGAYAAKVALIEQHRQEAAASDGRTVLVYLDEISIERQPTLANDYEEEGDEQPRARRSHHSDTISRVVGTLDCSDGRVVFARASKITLATLVAFYKDLCASYPDAERIYVVQDNWPVHSHPDVLVALEEQLTPFAWRRPSNWSDEPSAKARKKWGDLKLPIQIVQLPTYASWLNPIEKLWRKLRQDVTHLHEWAEDLPRLRSEIDRFLEQFAGGSDELLRYVGLAPKDLA